MSGRFFRYSENPWRRPPAPGQRLRSSESRRGNAARVPNNQGAHRDDVARARGVVEVLRLELVNLGGAARGGLEQSARAPPPAASFYSSHLLLQPRQLPIDLRLPVLLVLDSLRHRALEPLPPPHQGNLLRTTVHITAASATPPELTKPAWTLQGSAAAVVRWIEAKHERELSEEESEKQSPPRNGAAAVQQRSSVS